MPRVGGTVRRMIDELLIRDLGVIEEASLRLSPGLTVITGETGAGKTMVVTALELLLGARADAGLVRSGAEKAYIEARLAPAPAAAEDWADGEDELIVSREIPADGRSRARINGRLAPVSALRDVIGEAVEVHAQHEHVRLERPAVQRSLLDRFAGDAHARNLERYRDLHGRWRAAVSRRERLDDDARERARELDRLEFELAEISAAGLDPEADGTIASRLELLEHAEELAGSARRAELAVGSEGAGEPLGAAVSALRAVRVDDEAYRNLRDRAEGLAAESAELAADLRRFADELELDEEVLEELRDRRQLIAGLQRKYGESIETILDYAASAADRVAALRSEQDEATGLDEQIRSLRAELDEVATTVRRGRQVAGEALARAVDGHLGDLAMPHARFGVVVEPTDPGPTGADTVRFELVANPGDPPRPLATAASGGERSRVALALEVALADVDEASVIVFDEVDAGIGGATALAVGAKLARLAHGRQVLCVTHLAQLAAFADVHHVVEKGVRGGRAVTTSRTVEEDGRAAELARMLSGDPGRDAGLRHAEELLAEARGRRAG